MSVAEARATAETGSENKARGPVVAGVVVTIASRVLPKAREELDTAGASSSSECQEKRVSSECHEQTDDV